MIQILAHRHIVRDYSHLPKSTVFPPHNNLKLFSRVTLVEEHTELYFNYLNLVIHGRHEVLVKALQRTDIMCV